MVKVTTNLTHGVNPISKSHPDADRIQVDDGHLHVRGPGNSGIVTIAIYAPGKWLDAVVEITGTN